MSEYESDEIGGYFGSHFSDETLEILALEKVRPQLKEKLGPLEVSLTETKWFDYRNMHFARATLLFAHTFETVSREIYRRHFDSARARFLKVLKKPNIFEGPQDILTGLWRARQHADAIGMPYDLYIETVMEVGLRYKREYLPRPTQLFGQQAFAAAYLKWKERQASTFFEVKDAHYRIENYQGTRDQDDHQAWVIEQAMLRPRPEYLLSKTLYQTRVIPERLVERWFGADMLAKAERLAA